MTDPIAAGAINNNDHTNCPTCGSCPTCGRPYRPFSYPYFPPNTQPALPFPPSPPWQQQPHPWPPNVTWCGANPKLSATAAQPTFEIYAFNAGGQ